MTSRQKKRNKAAKWVGNVLLLAGSLAMGIWLGSTVGMKLWEQWQSRAFDRTEAAARNGRETPAENQIAPPAKGAVMGRLSIPRLGVEAMIREGTADRILSVALGHIPGTALPGQSGNVGVAGHRDSLFRGLRNVAKNDDITFETPSVTYTYRVESTRIVTPEHVEVLKPDGKAELTLVTCYPFDYIGAAPERFIVKAELVSRKAVQNNIPQQPLREAEVKKPDAHNDHSFHEVSFEVTPGHSRELIPGKVWFGLDSTDPASHTVSGWLWVIPERRTIWLRYTETHQPVLFDQDGQKHELFITDVSPGTASGYMVALTDRG